MKLYKLFLVIALAFAVTGGQTSCGVHLKVSSRHDNGKHKGWFKNPKNPHHPGSTNPGQKKKGSSGNKGNGNGNGNGNGKKK